MKKLQTKKSFTLVELMIPSFKTQAFFKRQNSNEFLKKGTSFHSKKSFTLVELMIVIAILAILSAIVIFALNPTEIFKKNRDSRRMADLQTLNKALVFMPTWNDSISLGNPNIIYLSLPDVSSTCTAYALPTLPTGFAYNCVTATNLRKADGTGWVPVNFEIQAGNYYLSALPVDPVNSEIYYYSYNPGGSFELNTFFETTDFNTKYGNSDGGDSTAYELGTNIKSMPNVFPHNWIKVPGNSLYGTSDFWVMQYEAKYAVDGRTGSDASAECRTFDTLDAFGWEKASPCLITWDNQNVVSSPLGSPIGNISNAKAKAVCESLGARLINNQEWMTIARNADQQPSNWTSGTVGTGYLFSGNTGNTNSGYAFVPGWGDIDKGLNRNIRASFVLSNGSKIYDFAGNMTEHVMFNANNDFLTNQPKVTGTSNSWKNSELTALTSYGDHLSQDLIKPTDYSWNSSKGMGFVAHRDGSDDANYPNRIMMRGFGIGYQPQYTGLYGTDFYNSSTSFSWASGFRCVK